LNFGPFFLKSSNSSNLFIFITWKQSGKYKHHICKEINSRFLTVIENFSPKTLNSAGKFCKEILVLFCFSFETDGRNFLVSKVNSVRNFFKINRLYSSQISSWNSSTKNRYRTKMKNFKEFTKVDWIDKIWAFSSIFVQLSPNFTQLKMCMGNF
jgi:hypothetical protein